MKIKKLTIKNIQLLTNFLSENRINEFTYLEKTSKDSALKILNNKDITVFSVIYENKIISYAILHFHNKKESSHVAKLKSIETLKEYRGRGAGSMLIGAIYKAIEKKKIKILELDVISINLDAINLYLKYKFIETGLIKNYFKKNGKYFDLVHMVKYF